MLLEDLQTSHETLEASEVRWGVAVWTWVVHGPGT